MADPRPLLSTACWRCRKCGSVERYKNGKCGPCSRAAFIAWSRANADWNRERFALWYAENSQSDRANGARWHRENLERRHEQNFTWRTTNAAYDKARKSEWWSENPELRVIYSAKRRARKRKALGSFTASEWKAKCAKLGNRCVDCGAESQQLTIGHIVPLILGGSNYIENLVPQCKSCNSKQGSKIHPRLAGLPLLSGVSYAR